MKKLALLTVTIAFLIMGQLQAQVVVSSSTSATPDASSALDIQSTDGGILIPRMTQAQRDAISSPANSLTIYQTNNTPGFYYNAGTAATPRWVRFSAGDIQSVSLSTDIEISSSTFTDVPSMPTLTFTAEKTEALVTLSASGYGYINSMSWVELRVWNNNTSSSVGGTNNKIQNTDVYVVYDPFWGINTWNFRTVTIWSTSFSKLLTGLTIGNIYTLKVQGQVGGSVGTPNAAIFPITYSDSQHLTLTVIQ